ncbi:unnamed protein product [Hymenolepis diminuta]|uniref:Uncharacterized protein n=1 Tax=Hymenolepis diminuta TaxID=6216 RepID=A0A564YT61_HYMDI|nr:unnamed protein product [Hymenolepis diminuta]
MSKRVHRFPLFSITASLHIKSQSALMLGRGLTQVTHIKLPLFFQTNTRWSVRTPTRPAHLLSSPARCSPSFSPSLCYALWLP